MHVYKTHSDSRVQRRRRPVFLYAHKNWFTMTSRRMGKTETNVRAGEKKRRSTPRRRKPFDAHGSRSHRRSCVCVCVCVLYCFSFLTMTTTPFRQFYFVYTSRYVWICVGRKKKYEIDFFIFDNYVDFAFSSDAQCVFCAVIKLVRGLPTTLVRYDWVVFIICAYIVTA